MQITICRIGRKFNKPNVFQVICLYKQGHSIDEIRIAAKVRYRIISAVLKSNNVKLRYAPRTFRDDGQEQTQKEKSHRYYIRHKAKVLARNNAWKERNPDKMAEYSRINYYKNPTTRLHRKKEWSLINPEIIKAQNTARKTPLAAECEFCGSTRNLQRHHPDYDYPSIFVTCCARCHTYLNNEQMEVILCK